MLIGLPVGVAALCSQSSLTSGVQWAFIGPKEGSATLGLARGALLHT